MKVIRVKDKTVWRQIRILFLTSALLFLINIYFGFDNALTDGSIPRWQILIHTHAGTLGWITLSGFGLAFWSLAGDREVPQPFVRQVKWLSWLAIGIFTGYIISFGLAFAFGRPFLYLLPVFGTGTALMIWAVAIYFGLQLRQQAVVTTTHLLISAGLIVASLGSTVGVLLGLEYIIGFFVPGPDRLGAHAATMEAYVLLFMAAIVEHIFGKTQDKHWTWGGMALALTWSLSGIFVLLGLLFNFPLGMLFVSFLLLGLILFLVRTGRHALRVNPLRQGVNRWLFFGTLWAVLWALFFISLGAIFAEDTSAIPDWVGVVIQHISFVGTMTNLLLGLYAVHSWESKYILPGVETAAMWLINLGLPLFFILDILTEVRLGAIVMGIGVLLGVFTMIVRLLLNDLLWAYDLLYRGEAPWEMNGPRPELVRAVESGHLQPCRAIDLGCGTGDNAIFLARNGFNVTGVDISPLAIEQAREKAHALGVSPTFVAGDVTNLNGIEGPFDLVLDYGCLGCVIGAPAREKYAETLLNLTRPGSRYILLNFVQNPNWRFHIIPNALRRGEVDRLFADKFKILKFEDTYDVGPFGMPIEFRWMRRLAN